MNRFLASLRTWFSALLSAVVLVSSACSSRNAGTDSTSPGVAERTAQQPGGMRSSSEWPGYNGGYNATRYSPVTQINTGNVASLNEVARFKLPETLAFQAGRC
jgi:glucose dehydrogenase